MSTEQKIAALRAELLQIAAADFDDALSACESPIEALFLSCLLVGHEFRKTSGVLPGPICEQRCVLLPRTCWLTGPCEDEHLLVQAQVPIEGAVYRPDFAFFTKNVRLIVELDGHDFHERTKEQAARDKSRDRAFVLAGWMVLRFTGSEIYRDVKAAVVATRVALLRAVERAA